MRILVTGGAGFIGSNLISQLLAKREDLRPEHIVNLDALTYASKSDRWNAEGRNPRYTFLHGSILNEALLDDILARYRIEAVINLAAETHVDRSIVSPEPFFQTNVIGTMHLLEACKKYWLKLSLARRRLFRFLHISTDEVFGSLALADPSFSEVTPYQPRNPYSASKAASDHLVRAYGHTYNLPIIVTNCSNNYGPRQFREKLIPLMIMNLFEGRPLPIYGDGQQRRDWLYVEDHCQALELVLLRGVPGERYAIGGESETTNLTIVYHLCDIMDQLAPREDHRPHSFAVAHVEDRPGHDRRYSISISKIRRCLGWEPRETLSTGLEKTVRWYLQQRSGMKLKAKTSHAFVESVPIKTSTAIANF